jgi:hypothetical protein
VKVRHARELPESAATGAIDRPKIRIPFFNIATRSLMRAKLCFIPATMNLIIASSSATLARRRSMLATARPIRPMCASTRGHLRFTP